MSIVVRGIFLKTLAAIVLMQGCGWKERVTFPSPSGKAEIEILQPRVFEDRAKIDLKRGRTTTEVFRSQGEAIIYFVDVYWTPGEKIVGVVITGSNFFRLAFDVSTGKQVPFETVRRQMIDHILANYNVPERDRKDPISWSNSPNAKEQFEAKYLGKLTQPQLPTLRVVHYEQMSYPPKARLQGIDGLVVLRIELDSEGLVKTATALGGPKILAED